ncbi:MAG: hypothetical protein ACKN92_00315 [Candidatus Nanopelagicaceae bacterium]
MNGFGLTEDQQIIVAIVISFTAYAIGRNLLIYFILAWINPVFAAVVLVVRHINRPSPGAQWIYEIVERVKLRLWSRKLKPDDFEDPKN